MGFEEYKDYYQQGEILLVNNRPEQALLYYEKAEREDPAHPELYVSKCIAYVNLDRIEEAEQEAKKAMLADRKHGEAYFHLGWIASPRGSVPEAVS